MREQGGKALNIAKGRVAGGRGFEPRLTESESAVLPLYDPPAGSIGAKIRPQARIVNL